MYQPVSTTSFLTWIDALLAELDFVSEVGEDCDDIAWECVQDAKWRADQAWQPINNDAATYDF